MAELTRENQKKLEELFIRYERYLFHIARQHVRRSSDAEDIVLEAFIRVIPHLDKLNLEDGHKARNYLVTIVERLSIDFHRRNKIFFISDELLFDFLSENDDQADQEGDLLIKEAMKKLKVEDEQILRLKYLQDMTNQEIAELLSIKEEAVRKRLERARKRLQKIMEDKK